MCHACVILSSNIDYRRPGRCGEGTGPSETLYLTCILLDFCTLHLHFAHLFLHWDENEQLKLKHDIEISTLVKNRQREMKSLVQHNQELTNTARSLRVSAAYKHLTALLLGAGE